MTLTQEDVVGILEHALDKRRILNIAGKSGTGKTTLAQLLVGNGMDLEEGEKTVWIQASKTFPGKRFDQLFGDRSAHLKENIFLIPNGPCDNMDAQLALISRIAAEDLMLPPGVRFMVIDNISHHLRYEVGNAKISEIKFLKNRFYNELQSLIFFGLREQITLVLTHEVSYNPEKDKTLPFCHKIYDKLDAVNVLLNKELGQEHFTLEFPMNGSRVEVRYRLMNHGLGLA